MSTRTSPEGCNMAGRAPRQSLRLPLFLLFLLAQATGGHCWSWPALHLRLRLGSGPGSSEAVGGDRRSDGISFSGSYDVKIWPLPAEVSRGESVLTVDPGLELVAEGQGGESDVVKNAWKRYRGIIFQHTGDVEESEHWDGKPLLRRLVVKVWSGDERLRLNTSEEYRLSLPGEDGDGTASLEAETVYGAVRGMETLSQLCVFNFRSKAVEIEQAPWEIRDWPRFRFRGLLIDTGRHFLPVPAIKEVLDAMAFSKLNVLHWHLVDEQAFPLEVPSRKELWRGSYTPRERYTVRDVTDVVAYAAARGIHVMPELDVPGHAQSWGLGYPELWPSENCREPLDVSKDSTFNTIAAILADLRELFPFELFHLGGDEVDTRCWERVPHVRAWLRGHGMSGQEAYAHFVVRAQEIAASLGWDPVNWEEPFDNFPKVLHPRSVVHNWWARGLAPRVLEAGLRCIVSNQDVWYLDHLDVPWQAFYLNEPALDISESDSDLLLGGEVCMWGETVDSSDLQQTIWPRAAAAAERLWSPRHAIDDAGVDAALPRLHFFRCLLIQRGVAAAPVSNALARSAPEGPSSCYWQ